MAGHPVVIGSTGFSDEQKKALEKLSEKVPVVLAPNMSLGVNVALELIKEAARLLKGYDIELVETHHNMKKRCTKRHSYGNGRSSSRGCWLKFS